jgi:hypothetical protein
LGPRHLVGEVVLLLLALARVKNTRHAVGVLQLRRKGGGVKPRGSGTGAVDIDEVWWRLRGLRCVIAVGLKGFAGAGGRVGRG